MPEVIVIGGGLAGLRSAIECARGGLVVSVFSKVYPLRSHSVAAQGGINVPLCNHPDGRDDSWHRHAMDTIKGGDFLNDQDAVRFMCMDAVERVVEIEHMGCPFSRTEDGRIAQRPFGGGAFPRTAYAADRTGHAMLNTLYEQCMRLKAEGLIRFYDEWHVVSVIVDGSICYGIVAYNIRELEVRSFPADAVIIATGGAGRVYLNSTNALINTGMGISLGYTAGIPLKDMEFIQFHPTSLYGTNILITEGARGEGGHLINRDGKRFLSDYPDSSVSMELAPRDIVARNIVREIKRGRGFEDSYVLLDLRHLGERRIKERLPGIRELSMKFAGIDPITTPIPVQPAQHYTMGGIDVNARAETIIKGLYAAGECACVSVHGANRLGGNSLLETLVFGRVAGRSALMHARAGVGRRGPLIKEYEQRETQRIQSLLKSTGRLNQWDIWERLRRTMMEDAGIFRSRDGLKRALDTVRNLMDDYRGIALHDKGRRMNMELYWAIELWGSLIVSEAIIMCALERQESRGSHFREDFPERDDQDWLRHTLIHYNNGKPVIGYKDVDTSLFKVTERQY